MRKQDCQLTTVFAVPQKISHSDASWREDTCQLHFAGKKGQ